MLLTKRHPNCVLYHTVERFQLATALAQQKSCRLLPSPPAADIVRKGRHAAWKLSSHSGVDDDDNDDNGANDNRWFLANKPLSLFNNVMPVLGE
jgi:hypothetical protein